MNYIHLKKYSPIWGYLFSIWGVSFRREPLTIRTPRGVELDHYTYSKTGNYPSFTSMVCLDLGVFYNYDFFNYSLILNIMSGHDDTLEFDSKYDDVHIETKPLVVLHSCNFNLYKN